MLEFAEQAAVPVPLHAYVVLEVVPVQLPVSVTFPPAATLAGVAVKLQARPAAGRTVTVAVAGVDLAPKPLSAIRL